MEARYVEVNLDSKPIKIVSSLPAPFPPPPSQPWLGTAIRFPYDVTDTNGEVFKIIAYTHTYVVWYAILYWSVNGQNGQSIISDGGKPFETAPLASAAEAYGYNGHGWYICPKASALNCALSE
jgi:hypothetical protein